MDTGTEQLLCDVDDGIALVTFNNPTKRNALSAEIRGALPGTLLALQADPEVRVVVLTGAGGRAFVSGADISKFADERQSEEAVQRYNALVERLYSHIYQFPKPTIAMIRGHCIGGGLNLAICCDVRIATD